MDMRIEYANHLGETLELGPESVYHYGKHTLFDAELAYEVENGSVGPLTRDPAERELPVMVQGSDGEDGLAARERLRDIIVAVKTFTRERYKKAALRQVARIGREIGNHPVPFA